jgi:hypothetical protein
LKWRKIGRIFNPLEHKLPNNCSTHAQSPQAIVFDDYVRVYFSTRASDDAGKFLSHVGFADFEKDLRTLIRVSETEVLPLGGLGSFDEHGVFPISPVRVGELIYGYTTGWSRRVSVSVETGIGLAMSKDDGSTFERWGEGPIVSATLFEPYLVCDAFVRRFDERFHMWYVFGTSWSRGEDGVPERTYKIGQTVSEDGINWTRNNAGHQIVSDRLGSGESQALPSVIAIGKKYHMFFCYRESFDFRMNSERGYRIGHASSEDLISWVRDDAAAELTGSPGDWDGEMQCYPHVFRCDGRIFLLYNGNEFGKYGFGVAELEI